MPAGEAPHSVAEEVGVEYDRGEACYRRAQALKEDLYDPLISLANLEFERGKLAMDLAIASLRCGRGCVGHAVRAACHLSAPPRV